MTLVPGVSTTFTYKGGRVERLRQLVQLKQPCQNICLPSTPRCRSHLSQKLSRQPPHVDSLAVNAGHGCTAAVGCVRLAVLAVSAPGECVSWRELDKLQYPSIVQAFSIGCQTSTSLPAAAPAASKNAHAIAFLSSPPALPLSLEHTDLIGSGQDALCQVALAKQCIDHSALACSPRRCGEL